MSIQNINFLQSDNDTAYIPGITTYTASSIYQSLANSGQRYGAKGDSVAISYFTIKSITGVAEGDGKDTNKSEQQISSGQAVPISRAETDAKSNTNKKSDVGKVIVSTDVVSIGDISVDAADNLLNDIAKVDDINAANNALVYYDKKNERLILRYKGISYTVSNIKNDNIYKPDDFNNNNIFNLIIAALNNGLISSDDSKVIIPEDYKFYYYYNSNNENEVWSSSEYIVVNYVTDITQVVPNTVCVIDKTAKQNYSSIYKFSISYNVNDTDENQILVTKVYALPYINNNHYWVVNDTETGIYASGDYTGQPNIMMIHTSYDTGTHKVLHMPSLTAYDYNDTINRVEWTQSYCNLNLITNITTSGKGTEGSVKTTTYKAYTYVPVISQLNTNDDMLSLYKNSLLINIIDSTYNKKLYTTSTLWQFDNVKKKFTYIENDTNGCVFSMADLSSTYSAFDVFVKNYSATFVPDEYQYRSLAFKQVKDELKNTDKNSQALANKGFLLSHVMSSANANQVSNNAVLKLYYNNYKLDSNSGYIPDLSNTYYSIDFNRKIDVKCLEEASITDGQTSKKSSTYYDYTFEDNVPILDIAETILDGVTIKDTQSILALNDSGTAYTASLGFDYYSFDKNTIYLSSSAYIPKIGNIDLAKSYYGEHLKGPSNFKIDFKNTITNTVVWNQLSENIYSTTYTPIYKDGGYPVEIYFNGYDGSDPNKEIYNQNIYTSVLATYCTEYKDELNGPYKPPKDIIAFKVYDANRKQNGTNESKKIILGETRLLNVNKFLKRFGIDIGTSPVKPTDEKYINYWLELGQYGLGTDSTQMIDNGQWLGNPIKLTYSVDTDTEDRNLIKKVIIEEQNVNNYWSSNSTVYLTPTYDNEHNQSGNTKNVMIRVGKRVVIDLIQNINGEKQFNFRIPSDLVPVNKLTNTSDSSKQVVTLDEYINSGKI